MDIIANVVFLDIGCCGQEVGLFQGEAARLVSTHKDLMGNMGRELLYRFQHRGALRDMLADSIRLHEKGAFHEGQNVDDLVLLLLDVVLLELLGTLV